MRFASRTFKRKGSKKARTRRMKQRRQRTRRFRTMRGGKYANLYNQIPTGSFDSAKKPNEVDDAAETVQDISIA